MIVILEGEYYILCWLLGLSLNPTDAATQREVPDLEICNLKRGKIIFQFCGHIANIHTLNDWSVVTG